MLAKIALGMIAVAMVMMAVATGMLALHNAQRPQFQTNLPYGLWARTRGGVLEIGRYENGTQLDGQWIGLFMWTSPNPISTCVPIMSGQCGVGVTLEAPFTVKLLGGHTFDTRDGPRVRLKDHYYSDSICGGAPS